MLAEHLARDTLETIDNSLNYVESVPGTVDVSPITKLI